MKIKGSKFILVSIAFLLIGILLGYIFGINSNSSSIVVAVRPSVPSLNSPRVEVTLRDESTTKEQVWSYSLPNSSDSTIYTFRNLNKDNYYTITGRVCYNTGKETNCTQAAEVKYCSGVDDSANGSCQIKGSGIVGYIASNEMGSNLVH